MSDADQMTDMNGLIDAADLDALTNKLQKPAAPPKNHHVDANVVLCTECGRDREEIGGILQCPVCGPEPGTELPEKPLAPVVKPPLIDLDLPLDPRCPACIALAETMNANRSPDPVEIGEREIVVEYQTDGRLPKTSLVCPVCDATEELTPIVQKRAAVFPQMGNDEPADGEKKPLEVRRRKKG